MKGVSKYTYKASVCQTFSLMSLIKKCIEMTTNMLMYKLFKILVTRHN